MNDKTVSITLNFNQAAVKSITNKAMAAVLRMGYDIANQARRNSPYRTGALRNSIRVEENDGVVEIIAGGKMGAKDIRYAAIQEFGGQSGRNGGVKVIGKHYMQRAKDFIMTGDYLGKYFGGIAK